MSIVERAARMFGTAQKADPAEAAAHNTPPVAGLVERAAATLPPVVVEAPPAAELAVAPVRMPPDAAASGPRLEISFERLRSQNAITPDAERTPVSECFRRIKRPILANIAASAGRVRGEQSPPGNLVMVTSALSGEGKTFCAVNLAISIAMELDRTVLLVDADVAKPSVMRMLGLDNRHQGLLDVLSDRADMAQVLRKTNIDKLTILPAGTQHRRATEMLAADGMRRLVHEMAERYSDRIIIFDSPPLLLASESGVLASHMSQIMVVVAAGETTEAAFKDALARLESSNVVGLILNKGRGMGSGHGYNYGYGYGYGYGHEGEA